MMAADRETLAERFETALHRKNLTVNALHTRTGISREVLTKIRGGLAIELAILERLATFLGEDVNEWRQLAGFDPLPTPAAADPTYEVDLGGHVVKAYGGGPIPPEDLEIIRAILEERARQRARKQGRE